MHTKQFIILLILSILTQQIYTTTNCSEFLFNEYDCTLGQSGCTYNYSNHTCQDQIDCTSGSYTEEQCNNFHTCSYNTIGNTCEEMPDGCGQNCGLCTGHKRVCNWRSQCIYDDNDDACKHKSSVDCESGMDNTSDACNNVGNCAYDVINFACKDKPSNCLTCSDCHGMEAVCIEQSTDCSFNSQNSNCVDKVTCTDYNGDQTQCEYFSNCQYNTEQNTCKNTCSSYGQIECEDIQECSYNSIDRVCQDEPTDCETNCENCLGFWFTCPEEVCTRTSDNLNRMCIDLVDCSQYNDQQNTCTLLSNCQYIENSNICVTSCIRYNNPTDCQNQNYCSYNYQDDMCQQKDQECDYCTDCHGFKDICKAAKGQCGYYESTHYCDSTEQQEQQCQEYSQNEDSCNDFSPCFYDSDNQICHFKCDELNNEMCQSELHSDRCSLNLLTDSCENIPQNCDSDCGNCDGHQLPCNLQDTCSFQISNNNSCVAWSSCGDCDGDQNSCESYNKCEYNQENNTCSRSCASYTIEQCKEQNDSCSINLTENYCVDKVQCSDISDESDCNAISTCAYSELHEECQEMPDCFHIFNCGNCNGNKAACENENFLCFYDDATNFCDYQCSDVGGDHERCEAIDPRDDQSVCSFNTFHDRCEEIQFCLPCDDCDDYKYSCDKEEDCTYNDGDQECQFVCGPFHCESCNAQECGNYSDDCEYDQQEQQCKEKYIEIPIGNKQEIIYFSSILIMILLNIIV